MRISKFCAGAELIKTGVDFGSATITAGSGIVSATAALNIFRPDPSPATPLNQAVAFHIDYAHSGHVTFGAPLNFPVNPTWSVTLGNFVGYPIIAGGKVFVLAWTQFAGVSLYALDKATGAVTWGPILVSTQFWGAHAYDHGKLFVLNEDGLLKSYDAATGQAGWATQLPNGSSSPPTAVNGVVYTGIGATVVAVDEVTGALLWTKNVDFGANSSPAFSGDGVFVSYPCQVYKFDPYSGTSLWHYAGPCEGGGGKTPAYENGRLYVRDGSSSPQGQIFDAHSGTLVGSFPVVPVPGTSGAPTRA